MQNFFPYARRRTVFDLDILSCRCMLIHSKSCFIRCFFVQQICRRNLQRINSIPGKCNRILPRIRSIYPAPGRIKHFFFTVYDCICCIRHKIGFLNRYLCNNRLLINALIVYRHRSFSIGSMQCNSNHRSFIVHNNRLFCCDLRPSASTIHSSRLNFTSELCRNPERITYFTSLCIDLYSRRSCCDINCRLSLTDAICHRPVRRIRV